MSVYPLRPHDPRELGGFSLKGFVASGGGGTVYVGYREDSARPAAVKAITPNYSDPHWRTRMAREVEAIQRVGELFTAGFVDADTMADQPWLATRYVFSPSLHTLVVEQGPLSERGGWWLLASVAEALLRIHKQDLVHRDLKPANVLVSRDGVMVIDFGLSRSMVDPSMTQQNMFAGTRFYAAPEQVRELRAATVQSDVYGLAATVVFAVTGHAPYDASTLEKWLAGGEPNLDGVPDAMGGLLERCLVADPQARPTVSRIMDLAMPSVLDNDVTVLQDVSSPLGPAYLAAIVEHERREVEQYAAAAAEPLVSTGSPPNAPDDLEVSSDPPDSYLGGGAYGSRRSPGSPPVGGPLGGDWAEQWNNAMSERWDRYDG